MQALEFTCQSSSVVDVGGAGDSVSDSGEQDAVSFLDSFYAQTDRASEHIVQTAGGGV